MLKSRDTRDLYRALARDSSNLFNIYRLAKLGLLLLLVSSNSNTNKLDKFTTIFYLKLR
jgi:hypothetical protein